MAMTNRELLDTLNKCAEEIAQKSDPFARQMISYFFESLEAEAIKNHTTSTFDAGKHILVAAKKILLDRLRRGNW